MQQMIFVSSMNVILKTQELLLLVIMHSAVRRDAGLHFWTLMICGNRKNWSIS